MLKNYIKIAFRNIRKNFSYSFINLFGLAVAFAASLVIGIWVYQEWSYDRHFDNADRIYRVGVDFMNVGDMAVGPRQFSQYAGEFPEVEQTAMLTGSTTQEVYINNRSYSESNVSYADSTFFDVFSYRFLDGDPSSALDQPNTAVLTRQTARKYFGDSQAVGKTIQIGSEKTTYTVTGVVDTGEDRSHMQVEIWLRYRYQDNNNWLSASVYNYVLLKEGISLEQLDSRLTELIKREVYASLPINAPFEEWIKSDGAYQFIAMPITDIYLKSNLKFEPTPGGSESNVNIFSAIAVLIVVIAGINFVNITTARSSIRAREIGVRKTLGSGRTALIMQFLIESVIISVVALVLAFGLGEIFLSVFHKITGLQLLESLFLSVEGLFLIGLIALGFGLLAGIYPAFYLTSIETVRVLKGQLYSGTGNNSYFRNGLVFVQFTISVCLLTGALVIYEQLQFIRSTDLGLNRENVMVITNAGELGDRQNAFKQAVLGTSGVSGASYNDRIPAGNGVLVRGLKTNKMDDFLPMQAFIGDYDMIATLGFQILEGREFLEEVASDTGAVILNQSAVKALGLENPVGETLNESYKVIGVVADFNFESLRKSIEPVALFPKKKGSRLAIKFEDRKAGDLIAGLQQLWKDFGIDSPLNYTFLDQNFEQLLEKDRILAKAVFIFTVLAIIISCLGLYGLSAYITEQRTKEIGIRRVLGARIEQVVVLLNKSFAKPILFSILLAIPTSYILLQEWLNNFAYKIELSIWTFVITCLLTLLIALVTVSWQTISAANMNPVESLKNE